MLFDFSSLQPPQRHRLSQHENNICGWIFAFVSHFEVSYRPEHLYRLELSVKGTADDEAASGPYNTVRFASPQYARRGLSLDSTAETRDPSTQEVNDL